GLFMERSNDTFRLRDRARYALGGLRQGGDGLHVMIGGGRARMIGRVGMHHVIADVTGMGVRPGDEAAFKVNPIYVDSSVVREYV
ncbi:MAG: hypothetical protein FWE70_06220, partial [Oscillospiraceae bacterium]|nr:hypothetical protein [Oscillospiraceae bacterium]